MLEFLLDKSVVFSFDKSGYARHSRSFKDLPVENTLGTLIITGGTGGIGKACADFLGEHGNSCIVTGREPSRFENKERLQSRILDLASWEAVIDFVKDVDKVDHLVLNAGGMPKEYRENHAGCEYQTASQLLGHLVLFEALHRADKLQKGAKVIFVSSGGMLLKKLSVDTLFQPDTYDKVDQYANVKRAQAIMTGVYAERFPQYNFAVMHPGWVGTRALEEGLPGFFSFFKNRLRTPYQGADTIIWLLYSMGLESGKFWFDRKPAKRHPLLFTRSTAEEERELIARVEDFIAGVFHNR